MKSLPCRAACLLQAGHACRQRPSWTTSSHTSKVLLFKTYTPISQAVRCTLQFRRNANRSARLLWYLLVVVRPMVQYSNQMGATHTTTLAPVPLIPPASRAASSDRDELRTPARMTTPTTSSALSPFFRLGDLLGRIVRPLFSGSPCLGISTPLMRGPVTLRPSRPHRPTVSAPCIPR